MNHMMTALVWTAPRQLELQQIPAPQPADGEVLLAVGAVGICGSELSGYLGQSSIRVPPLVMGHEAAGTIVGGSGRLASGIPARTGQRVAFNPLLVCGTCDRCRAGRSSICRQRRLVGAHLAGAFADMVAVPAAQCHLLPDGISDVAGSLTEPLACGVRAVALAGTPRRLLILGAGPIGVCCLVAARAAGIDDIAISDIAARRLDLARSYGATATIDVSTTELVREAARLAPDGFDAVIDAVGAGATRQQALRAVVPGGRVVFLGLHDETTELPVNYVVRQEVELVGSFAYTADDFARAFALLSEGALRPDASWLDERPLHAGAASFEELLAGQARATKIVLRPA